MNQWAESGNGVMHSPTRIIAHIAGTISLWLARHARMGGHGETRHRLGLGTPAKPTDSPIWDEHIGAYRGYLTARVKPDAKRRVRLVREIPGFCGVNNSLVDMGCGSGEALDLLYPEMGDCVGFDHIPNSRKGICRVDIDELGDWAWGGHPTQWTGSFDRLISFEVIEHLGCETSVCAFYDALKPGGLAAISVPNKFWLFETHGAGRFKRVPFLSWAPEWLRRLLKANARIYTKGRIKALLESVGFEVLDMKYITAPLDVLPDGLLKRLLVRFLFTNDTTRNPFLSTSIFVVARKA